MPFLKTPEYAADKIYNGLVKGNAFEIHFPKGLTLTLKFLRILPYRLYLFLVDKLVKRQLKNRFNVFPINQFIEKIF